MISLCKEIMLFKLLLVFFICGCGSALADSSKIDKRLLNAQHDEKFNIMVTFSEGTESVIQGIESRRFANRGDRISALHDSLVEHADENQRDAKAIVRSRGFKHQSFWISNQLYVKDATIDLITDLAFRDEIKEIAQEDVLEIGAVIVNGPPFEGPLPHWAVSWGVRKIKAWEAREYLDEITGKNGIKQIIVGSIDTGVRYTHEALKDNWVGAYGWFNPYNRSDPIPSDRAGHGTHTVGTMVGKGGIGVFPDGKWMACRGCSENSCFDSYLQSCAQWMICPTRANGKGKDCSKAPHIVNNSWGSTSTNRNNDRTIAALHAARIIPFWSAGNEGSKCLSITSPGDHPDVIASGSTTSKDDLSFFSSVGPTKRDGGIKPDIVAPGHDIVSAWHTSDTAYQSLSGTSMASPHSCGAAAMLLAYNNKMRYEDIRSLLIAGAETEPLVKKKRTCGGIPDDKFPNNHYGQGRINVLNSLKKAEESHKP